MKTIRCHRVNKYDGKRDKIERDKKKVTKELRKPSSSWCNRKHGDHKKPATNHISPHAMADHFEMRATNRLEQPTDEPRMEKEWISLEEGTMEEAFMYPPTPIMRRTSYEYEP
jgi:hypothetical protein